VVDDELDDLVTGVAALAIEGAKGVGKTATATVRASTAYRLDDPTSLAVLRGDPARVLQGRPPVLLDEWQLMPQTWDLVTSTAIRPRAASC